MRAAAETLRWIEPMFGELGITRLADVTWLDDIGVPVYQAVRPDSYLLSVAQGKGLTPVLAKVSAAMEAIEMWHAERLPQGERTGPVGEIAPELDYRLDELALPPRHHLNPALRLEWTRARHLASGASTVVPTDCLRLDGRVSQRWKPRLFVTSSNGLASGNTVDEAVLHSLYEVIERDALVRAGHTPVRLLDLGTVDGAAGLLIERFAAAGVAVRVELVASPLGLPCFRARIVSDTFPVICLGMGCHLDRDVALCRALTEAAQSRVTSIAGVRDDMTAERYWRAEQVTAGYASTPDLDRPGSPNLLSPNGDQLRYQDIESVRQLDLTDDLRLVTNRVLAYTGRDPLVVEHTRPEFGIPVVRVICPTLLFDPDLM